MIRFDEVSNVWISNVNLDETGMPTANLHGDWQICTCSSCYWALENGMGENFYVLFADKPSYLKVVK